MEDELQDITNELERLYQHKWDPDLGIQIIRLKILQLNLQLNQNKFMKNKLKLWILRIEGWKNLKDTVFYSKEKHSNIIQTEWALFRVKAFFLEEAWNKQFPNFSSIIRTNIFWLVFPMVLGALFMLFSDNSTIIPNGIHWFNYAGLICFIWPVLFTFIGIGTWVIKLFKKKDK